MLLIGLIYAQKRKPGSLSRTVRSVCTYLALKGDKGPHVLPLQGTACIMFFFTFLGVVVVTPLSAPDTVGTLSEREMKLTTVVPSTLTAEHWLG